MVLNISVGSILRFVLTLSMVFAALNTDWLMFGICLGIFAFVTWLEHKEFDEVE